MTGILTGAAILVAAACGAPPAERGEPITAASPEHATGRSKLLAGGGWNINGAKTRPGEPFEITALAASVEVKNNTRSPVVPVCVLEYGSQVAVIDTDAVELEPREQMWLSGHAEFRRPLDDYESSSAWCYTRLPRSVSNQMRREQRAMTMGRPTKVPNLVGHEINSHLPNFSRGLDIRIVKETTPCTEARLMKMSRYVDPFGKPACGDPVVMAQDPNPGSMARVGDEVAITVASKRPSGRS